MKSDITRSVYHSTTVLYVHSKGQYDRNSLPVISFSFFFFRFKKAVFFFLFPRGNGKQAKS